jgi:hypothetical protein
MIPNCRILAAISIVFSGVSVPLSIRRSASAEADSAREKRISTLPAWTARSDRNISARCRSALAPPGKFGAARCAGNLGHAGLMGEKIVVGTSMALTRQRSTYIAATFATLGGLGEPSPIHHVYDCTEIAQERDSHNSSGEASCASPGTSCGRTAAYPPCGTGTAAANPGAGSEAAVLNHGSAAIPVRQTLHPLTSSPRSTA